MKHRIQLFATFFATGLCLFFTVGTIPARAGINFWDPTGPLPVCAPAGTWENPSWAASSGLTASTGHFTEGSVVVFAAGTVATCAYTVTANVNHTVAGIYVGGVLGAATGNVTINGTGSFTLPSGFDDFSINSGGSLTISNVLGGSGALTAQGSGQLYLRGASTYGGGTFLGYSSGPFTGIIGFNNSASFGVGGICISNTGAGACALMVDGTSAVTIPNNVTSAGNSAPRVNILANPAGVTFSGNWLLGGNAKIGASGAADNLVIISGVMSGSGGLTTFGPGIMCLEGVNTYTGNTVISSGVLSLALNGSISDSPSLSIAAGAALDVSGRSAPFTLGSGQSFTATGSGTMTGAVTNVGTSTAAVLNGPTNGDVVSLGSQPVILEFTPARFTGDSIHPSLYVLQGTLALAGNAFTVTNAAATPLGAGTYVLIQQATGAISSTGTYPVNVAGTGLAANTSAAISVTGGTVNLVVQSTAPGPLTVTIPPAYDSHSGTFSVTYIGSAHLTYTVHTATNAAGPWTVLGTVTADGSGVIAVTDTPSPALPACYYWITYP